MTTQVLLVDDDDALRASLAQTIELAGMTPLPTSSFVQARRNIRANFNGVILSDIRMPHQDGFDLLGFTHNIDADLPVILLTGHSDVPTAMRAMKEGAWDYLEKPCSTDRLVEALTRALAHRALVLKSRRVERALLRNDAAAENFPGQSRVSDTLRTALRRIAATRNHAHIHGAAGVGKKLAAYTINRLAPEPVRFLQVNVGAAPATVFRDMAIPDMPTDLSCKSIDLAMPEQQQDLLDLLQAHPQLRVLSSSRLPLAVSGVSTLIDGLDPDSPGIEVLLPTVGERREDLPELFETLLRQTARSLNMDMPEIPETLVSDILTRPWDGNLPELRSFAMSFALGQQVYGQSDQGQTLAEQIDTFERLVLTETLKRCAGAASEAARSLGMPRNTFYDRLAKHGISPKDFR